MRTQKAKVVAIGLITLAGCTGLVKAASLPAVVITPSGGTFAPDNGKFYGWMFRPTEDIWVTDLGLYDVGGNGLTGTWRVCIWKYVVNPNCAHGWEVVPVVSTTIGPIDGAPSADGCHYVSVRDSAGQPILLTCVTSGTYERNYFVGFWFDGTSGAPREPLGLLSPSSAVLTPDAPVDHATGYPVQAFGVIPSSSPWDRPVGAGSNVFGVNFKYTRNDPPVPGVDSVVTQINTPVTIDVLANATDPDGDPLSISFFTPRGTNGGTVELAEGGLKLKYTPVPNVVGSDTFEYIISDGNGGTATATVSVTIDPGTITIDIKPGSYPNSINLGANGVIPVAVLSSETFDATTLLDPDTIFLEGRGVAIRGRGNRLMSHSEDVNGDGRADLVVQFDTENLVPDEFRAGTATVTVNTPAGLLYLGEDEITIVPPLP